MTDKNAKFFRDPIHGYIEVDGRFLKLIDSPFFQRLRRVKQLAFTDLVYHGAEHSRFGHSLGAYDLASVIADQVDLKGNIRDEFCLAALLHDLGHPPCSHAFESVLQETYGRSTHEDYTEAIIMHSEIGDLIESLDLDKRTIVKLIRGKYVEKPELGFLNDLISSELDIDRMDFLLRDAYYCGVPYGQYDIERLLLSLKVHGNKVVVQEKGRHAVESFILCRFYMYTQVYTHRTRRAFDTMLKAIFSKEMIKRLDYPKPIPKDINELIDFDDAWLLDQIKEISKGTSTESRIAKLFEKREHIRAVIEKIAYADVESKSIDPSFTTIEALESFKKELADETKMEQNMIFFDKPWKDLPFEKRYRQYYSSGEEEAKTIKILLGDGEIRDVAFDISSLAYHLSRKLAQVIRVYTLRVNRNKLARAIVRRHPELKGFLVRKYEDN